MGSKVDKIISEMNKRFDEQVATRGISIIQTSRIPFSSPRMNYMSYGGLPRGMLIEFLGEESGGKSTTALDIVANAQKLFKQEWQEEIDNPNTKAERVKYLKDRGAKQVVYADCEMTLDADWAQLIGVDTTDLIMMIPQGQYAEDIFDAILALIETDEIGLVVIDSLAAMMSKQEFEKDVEEKTYGGISAPLTVFSRKAVQACKQYNCSIIGINQLREDLKNPYNIYKTPGGRAWKFFCSVRLAFMKGHFIDNAGNELKMGTEEAAGNKVEVAVVKSKVFKPDRRKGYYSLNYERGIDACADLVDVGLKCGAIKQSGSWITFVELSTGELLEEDDGGAIKVQGKVNTARFLEDNPDIRKFVEDQIASAIS